MVSKYRGGFLKDEFPSPTASLILASWFPFARVDRVRIPYVHQVFMLGRCRWHRKPIGFTTNGELAMGHGASNEP